MRATLFDTDPPLADTGRSAVAATVSWLEQAVIGLDLCPFAKAVRAKDQVRFVISDARGWAALRSDLADELADLAAADPAIAETSLLVCPNVPADFEAFNQFLDEADDAVRGLDLEGVIQVASFHPHYRFEGTDEGDVTNATNRSPYPTLHLLRESSVERAVAVLSDPDSIYEANLRTLAALGAEGWARLQANWAPPTR
ncbi:MAG: DUF1415 domain-containing protein [Caldimonas sp.]